ncbi:MAG: asparagine synthase-related protein, partial [Nitrososphaerota archaeon]
MVSGLVALVGKGDLSQYLFKALNSMSHRAKAGYLVQGEVYDRLKDVALKIDGDVVVAGCMRSSSIQAKAMIHGKVYSPGDFDLLFELERSQEPSYLASKLEGVDGAYAFAHPYDKGLVFVRDPLGTKPLYIARKEGLAAIASEMKALKSIGFEGIDRVKPGWLYYLTLDGQASYRIRSWDKISKIHVNMDEASSSVLNLLKESIKARTSKIRNVAIGFSGGLDSSFIAYIASEYTNVRLFTVGTPGSQDLREAEKAAELLDLPISVKIVDETSVKKLIKGLSMLIESEDIMDLAIGLVFYLTAEAAQHEGCEDLLLGQLADELFGG